MVISSSNISFSSIQTEFGGINPISVSEYYRNSSTNLTSNITSLPLIGNTISISMFSDLAKDINILYTTAGTFTYTVPAGIKTLCVLCVGGGGAGAYNTGSTAGGGGGGGLIWVNSIVVTTGQQFTIIVGAGGNGASGVNLTGQNGSATRFYFGTGTTFNIQANGGDGGATRTGGTRALTNTAFTVGTSGGGNGGAGGTPISTASGGGGGAAGYSGNGGNGGTNVGSGTAGAGGGGGGGSQATNSNGAGGVGILNGQGTNGTAGGPSVAAGGGSGGGTGPLTPIASGSIAGGLYGGGGGGNRNSTQSGLNRSGGRGAVRIMALGKDSNRSFPTNALAF